ncbi:related to enoyl-CoA hydratase precursor, mitochondrial [Rhynchosporium agropyri]|uniref:Related to enoyl-CoA hydratase, mitochondrial n=1 Tax=Rhynchosporium agropyri TaxID=914238 RepID=A0A1E1KJ30_9HELO|nr:related to enoyl-CoA hydratase precursor, mitochondrial [Rhynchosporium agropyri]
MRVLFRPSKSPASRFIRCYSTQPTPLVKVFDVPAPGSGRIRILSLARPAARNAISRQLLHELRTNIDFIASEYDADGNDLPAKKVFGGVAGTDHKGPTRAVVLASEVDSCFCAGADLKERAGFTAEETAAFLTNLRATFTAISVLPIPTISAISSLALGGGLELALCTTLRVLSSTAQVGLPETRLGIIPGAGGTYRLPGIIGLNRARDLILTGRRVSAAEAYFLGIADRLVEVVPEEGKEGEEFKKELMAKAKDETLSAAVKLAGEICQGGPIAVRSALKAVEGAREEVENKMYERVVVTEDRDEALKAFREKRMPEFKGR